MLSWNGFLQPKHSREMAQLLMKNQQTKEVITPIPFHGDQLIEERARNVIGTFQDGDNEFDRLHSECADWHAKVNLYEVRLYITLLYVQ